MGPSLHTHVHQAKYAGSTKAPASFSQIVAFIMSAQPANALVPLFTALEHLREGQQPRRERKQRTQEPIFNRSGIVRTLLLGHTNRCVRLAASLLLVRILWSNRFLIPLC